MVMSVREIDQWEMSVRDLHRRMILAPTPRERERWHAVWLLAQGWTASSTAKALGRDPHTIGRWAAAFGEGGPEALIFEQTGGVPPLTRVCKNEIIATNRPRHPWIPAYAGMTEWAR